LTKKIAIPANKAAKIRILLIIKRKIKALCF